MTTAYDLTQTDQAYILVALASVFVFWSVMSVPLIKTFGNRKMFAFGLTSMTIASLMLVGAPYSVTTGSATASELCLWLDVVFLRLLVTYDSSSGRVSRSAFTLVQAGATR